MPTTVDLRWLPSPADGQPTPSEASTLVLIGRAARLRSEQTLALSGLSAETRDAMLSATKGGDRGGSATAWVGKKKVVLGVLPEPCSRHNSPSRAWAIPSLAKAATPGDAAVVVLVDGPEHARASALAVARAFPVFDARSGERKERTVTVSVLAPDGPVDDPSIPAAMAGVRLAAELFDQPTSVLDTTAFVARARAVAAAVGAEVEVIEGQALVDGGFGGLLGVGRAATAGPALVALKWRPAGFSRHVGWVGKGIVYDTGGLSIKGKTSMPGMKGDMGGAAAVLGAFHAACAARVSHAITAVLCLAENAVGPEATRPDDILHMKSGKTVEINNTDAEGRLVLADGVAWITENHDLDALFDLATLTGAALVATGKVHAALYCNDAGLEDRVVRAGRRVGEPCHPLIYAPELFRKEFASKVADMKNSVADRANAQSSCAGQFVGNHLPKDPPPWCHIDLAGPAWGADDRGTGYGVGLLLEVGDASGS
jgi:probable aminopeptidase NPEPL1